MTVATRRVPAAQQHPQELAGLLALYGQRKPRRVLEIGTFAGGTLYHWLQGHPDLVVTVDDFRMGHDNRRLYPQWTPNGVELVVVEGMSQAPVVLKAVAERAPYDWAFIDADHSYEAVRADWESYRPFCNGVVAFHDILGPTVEHPEIEVSRLWREIKADYLTAELVADPHADWGGIGVAFLDEGLEALEEGLGR